MTGQELYELYQQERVGQGLAASHWSCLSAPQQAVWHNLAEQIRAHVQDSIGKVFD